MGGIARDAQEGASEAKHFSNSLSVSVRLDGHRDCSQNSSTPLLLAPEQAMII
jgi:hypothetical protein